MIIGILSVFIFFFSIMTHGVAADSIKVGSIFAKTSKIAFENVAAFEGVRFAVDELNRNGGLLGRQVSLIEFDNQGTAIGSKVAAEQAVEAGVVAVFGATWSSHSLAMAPVLQAAKIPMITPISTNPDVTQVGDYIFRACYTDPFQGRVLSQFALGSLQARSAGVVVNVDDRYSQGLADMFIKSFEQNGGQILFVENYLENTADFSSIIERIDDVEPDIVFLPGQTKMSAFILRQVKQSGLEAVFLGGDGWSDEMYEIAGDALEGNYYSNHWHFSQDNRENIYFITNFTLLESTAIRPVTALAVDSVNLFADAVKRAASFEPAAIRDALAETDAYQGITGTFTFDANGDPVKSVVILQFSNGQSKLVKRVEPVKD